MLLISEVGLSIARTESLVATKVPGSENTRLHWLPFLLISKITCAVLSKLKLPFAPYWLTNDKVPLLLSLKIKVPRL